MNLVYNWCVAYVLIYQKDNIYCNAYACLKKYKTYHTLKDINKIARPNIQ